MNIFLDHKQVMHHTKLALIVLHKMEEPNDAHDVVVIIVNNAAEHIIHGISQHHA
jgi:hypothetical protein